MPVHCVLLLLAAAMAQDPPPPPAPALRAADLLARYGKLDRAARSDVVRNVERQCQRSGDELLQGIQGRQRGRASCPQPGPARWYEPREYAPAAAPRGVVTANTAAHQQATAGMRPFVLLPELHKAVVYDWRTGAVAQGPAELGDDQRAANYAHGHAPGADHALAQVLAVLDRDPGQRELAGYFEHLYADRNGAVFAGVTLYDAWRAGNTLEMPDTDAIAFARHCLGTASFVAPLPGDRRRERLYQKMADGYARHHAHRTLLQALAATFLAAEPVLDPSWQTLVDRGHWLWQRHGRAPEALATWLAQQGDRSDVLRVVDAERKADDGPGQQHRQALAAMATWLRQCFDRELTAAGV